MVDSETLGGQVPAAEEARRGRCVDQSFEKLVYRFLFEFVGGEIELLDDWSVLHSRIKKVLPCGFAACHMRHSLLTCFRFVS